MARGPDPRHRPRGLLGSVSYALAQLHRLAHAQIETELASSGLSLRTHQVLVCLNEFGELSQQQVCDSVDADRSDMVRIVDRLEELKLVVRERDRVDRRKQILKLTPAGLDAVSRADAIIECCTNAALARLSEAERSTLHRLTLKALGESVGGLPELPPEVRGPGGAR